MPRGSSLRDYERCVADATKTKKTGLCPRGYCTAKHTFAVYPSAYANGYAASVCAGAKPDFAGQTKKSAPRKPNPGLRRWFAEEWVNVCEKGDGPGGFALCGSGSGIANPEKYPYCRAYYKQPGTTVVTAQELTKKEIADMCRKKRSRPQGVDGAPTRVRLPTKVRARDKPKHLESRPGSAVRVPAKVISNARLGLELADNGFNGGAPAVRDRGVLLVGGLVDMESLADLRSWFLRYGVQSRDSFACWVADGRPRFPDKKQGGANLYRRGVAWLQSGGEAAYRWLQSPSIENALRRLFPQRTELPN